MNEKLPIESVSHYRILSRIGAGGMGEVYLGKDTRLGRKVAIKVLPAGFTRDTERLRRFMLEAKAASALNHPNIITVYDIGESDDGRFLVMEFVDGRTVRQILAEGASIGTLVELGSQMAKGLAAAHAAGITHRDIKPDNIMVRTDGYVKILDFGLARLAPMQDSVDDTATNSTEPGQLLGTLKYMSPEQAGGEGATAASDVYSLGMVFFEMATGRYPHPAQSSMKLLCAILLSSPGSPAAVNPLVPAELDSLICRMLHKDPAQRPTAAQVAAALGSEVAQPPVQLAVAARHTVGHERPRQDLRAALQGVGGGRGAVVCVTGEPGIGKSTLVEEFLAAAGAEGLCTIARGRCSERLAGTEAYLPLLEALEGFPGMAPVMKQLAPTWYAQVAPSSLGDGDGARASGEVKATSQDRLKRELGTFLEEVGRSRPVLLFLDDLHWADVSTIDVLTYLASQFDGLRLLILVTYRPSDMLLAKHPFLQIKPDLQARGLLREIRLSFLSEAEIAQYLRLEFPEHQFPEAFPRLIHAKTEGSPLFMADLVRYLRDRSVIRREGETGPWKLVQGLPAIERELPESVRGMIERKIAQLGEDDRKLLDVASVQGYEFDSAVLATVMKLDANDVEDRLEKLEKVFAFVKLVREAEFPNRQLTLRYRFVHVLYQNALYTALRATRRATWSREVAQVIEACYGQRRGSVANELAQLWEAAREFGTAAAYYGMAARQASQVFADQESAALARRGLDALAMAPESIERTDQELMLQVVLGVALRAVKGFADPEVGKAFARARELCPHSGQSLQMVPVLRGLWEFYEVRADYAKALPYARQLLELAEYLRDDGVAAVACDVMGDTSVWMGDFGTAWKHLERGIQLYDPERHRGHLFLYGYDTGMACLSYGAIALWHLGYPDEALARMNESSAIAERVKHPMTRAFAAIMAAWLHRLRGEMALAEAQGELAVAVSTEHGLPFFLGFGQITRGWARVGLGRVGEGIRDIEEGMACYKATGSELGVSLWMGCLAEGYAAAGRVSEARAVVDEALAFVERTGERVYEAGLRRLLGNLSL